MNSLKQYAVSLFAMIFGLTGLLVVSSAVQAEPLDYFLPKDKTYSASITTPEAVIGHQVGEFHVRYDQLQAYMAQLAGESERVRIIPMGVSWERRPQNLVAISSPETIRKLDAILASGKSFKEFEGGQPLVVWLGYSIHGNEASGTNASLLTAYHLTALEGEDHEQFLNDTLVLIDPSFNPDGYGRFSTWVNNNRGLQLSSDQMDREHREGWPNGRTNHYRFDLNRDWLLTTQNETRNRLKWFHYFHPHVMGDFHEMGPDSTYFFQPGVPSRQNPLTPKENFEITDDIGRYHARAMDAIGSLYYSKQNFDDFYFGKGSTYPDIQGSIGILFEQASSRGHLQDSVNGPLSFSFAIRNHFTTSLSTLAGAYANLDRLKDYRARFFHNAADAANSDDHRGLVIADNGDKPRLMALVDTLLRHQIEVYELASPMVLDGRRYQSGILIPYQQRQYRLIKAMFETRTRFEDNTFYDVSAWNFGHAYNLPYAEVERRRWKKDFVGRRLMSAELDAGQLTAKSAVGYVIDWQSFKAPAAVGALLAEDVRVRVARKAFQLQTASGDQQFKAGSMVIPVGIQDLSEDALYQRLQQLASEYHLRIAAITSGYALKGIDIGSPDMEPVTQPRPLMLTGHGVSAYDSGEIWYFLDNHLEMPVSQVNLRDFGSLDLNRYSHLIMVNGNYKRLDEADVKKIKDWVKAGGVIIGMRSAVQWLSDQELLGAKVSQTSSALNDSDRRLYSDMDEDNAQRVIGGSIFEVAVDQSHPLAFGINSDTLSVFRNHRYILEAAENPYQNVMRYSQRPLVSGYVSQGNLEAITDSVMLSAKRHGRGSVIAIADNPVFRGYWLGSSRLVVNSLFLGTAFERPRS